MNLLPAHERDLEKRAEIGGQEARRAVTGQQGRFIGEKRGMTVKA
jgi:hypothetical protein